MASDEFLCARCARHTQTCCQNVDVFVTPADVQRIASFSGRSEFTEFRAPDDPVYLQEDDDPVWMEHVFRQDHSRRVLRRQSNGDCTFLGERGCILPLETRPLVCRLYPYDYTAAGIRDKLAGGCPVELLAPGQRLIEALDMRLADAQRWHRQLYDELALEKDA